MTQAINKISFDEAHDHIKALDTDETTASAHGILCGLLCVNSSNIIHTWIDEIINNNEQNLDAYKPLEAIFNQTVLELNSEEFSFAPLINQAGDLTAQIETLRQWCSGYLLGLGLAKFNSKDKETLEAMSDIALMAKMPTKVEDIEENHQDFNQIFEHCRISVLLIYQEGASATKQG